MKKLLSLIGTLTPMLAITATSSLTVACTAKRQFEKNIDYILRIRDIGYDYKFISSWKNEMDRNGRILNSYLIQFQYAVINHAIRWGFDEEIDLTNYYVPKEQFIISDPLLEDKIVPDFELPYRDWATPFGSISMSASTLGEEEFFQIYNYKTLQNLGYEFSVTSSIPDSIEILRLDDRGAVWFKGTKKPGDGNIIVEASHPAKETLRLSLSVSNSDRESQNFLQWRAYQYLKFEYNSSETMQYIMAAYLQQIYAQMMYNASYNSNPAHIDKLGLLDSRMIDRLFCFYKYDEMISYFEIWPPGDSELSGYYFFFSFDFYVHPSIVRNDESTLPADRSQLYSNPLTVLNNYSKNM
ncbi:hypothetical protein SCLARK_00382 [Spiroplasma clarkii]|uniref:hypothetical protein n=1 Tax=Spiroplasma clarkii TaxID=2139 RepID=UPI000B565418|nr:hypothetical protein [Spiroplasma clarkii]ARU91117.1 hypothetical protein SCLARK_00382 [Spiroplasma clarkii]